MVYRLDVQVYREERQNMEPRKGEIYVRKADGK